MSNKERGSRMAAWLTQSPARVHHDAWFPGRIIGGAALILAPVVWGLGLLFRHLGTRLAGFTPEQLERFDRQTFAALRQLAAFEVHSGLVMTGYALYLAAAVLLFPAIATLARVIAFRAPRLAFAGGTLVIFSLFARAYFAGVDQFGFQLIPMQGLDQATGTVLDSYVDVSYGHWRIPVTISAGSIVGATLLAIGAYRSGALGTLRCLVLIAWGWTWMGVLKEPTFPTSWSRYSSAPR